MHLLLCLITTTTATAADLRFIRDFGGASLFRDADYGAPLVLGGQRSDAFRAVGYAHAEDRIFQIFLRIITANGRLAEFFGRGENDVHVNSDLRTLRLSYSDDEMQAMFGALNSETRDIHSNFVDGMRMRVDEVNQSPESLLPYEFGRIGLSTVPVDVFDLLPVMHYTLTVLRGLCSGHYPDYQLDNMLLFSSLEAALNQTTLAMAAFNDVATEQGAFPLNSTVVAPSSSSAKARVRQRSYEHDVRLHQRLRQQSTIDLVRRANQRDKDVNAELRRLGAITADGSWAIVDASNGEKGFGQYGPQDPNMFPTTFYEVFIDSEGVQAHYFSEPGTPINQIYGVWGNITMGRNRGFALNNDMLLETVADTSLNRSVSLLVKDEAPVPLDIYRSSSGGFVVDRDEGTGEALTLRMAYFGQELQGLNMLCALFRGLPFAELLATIFEPSMQSDVIHSHLEIADSRNVAAAMNGKYSQLPAAFDRRFPLVRGTDPLPEYTLMPQEPVLQVNQGQGPSTKDRQMRSDQDTLPRRYFAWNSPYDASIPYGSAYTYGGTWRSAWFDKFFAEKTQAGTVPVAHEMLSGLPEFIDRGCALSLGSCAQTDRSASEFMQQWLALLPPAAPFSEVRKILQAWEGFAWPAKTEQGQTVSDISDTFLLANAWVYQVILRLFGELFEGTRFAIPSIPDIPNALPLPLAQPNQRFSAILALLTTPTATPSPLAYDWLNGTEFADVLEASLNDALAALPLASRPWGVGRRPSTPMNAIGGDVLSSSNPIGEVLLGQQPSLNLLIEIDECGPIHVDSSVNFGVSGNVLNSSDGSGSPVFSPHTTDQLLLFQQLRTKPAPRLFNVTTECRARRNAGSGTPTPVGVWIGVGVAVVVVGIGAAAALLLRYRAARIVSGDTYTTPMLDADAGTDATADDVDADHADSGVGSVVLLHANERAVA